jgi:hypothetical protein
MAQFSSEVAGSHNKRRMTVRAQQENQGESGSW